MNHKRRMFIEAYLKEWNATAAAEAAGYKHPRQQGSRLLSNVDIQQAINERIKEVSMSADEVLVRLADQARGSMADFISIDATLNEETGFNTQWSIDLEQAASRDKLHLVRRVSVSDKKLTIELYDAQAALGILARILAANAMDQPAEMVIFTPEQWKAEASKRLANTQKTISEFEGDDGQ